MRPSRTGAATSSADARTHASYDALIEAGDTPSRTRRDHAHRQQRLPVAMGGDGVAHSHQLRAAGWVSSVARNWSELCRTSPRHIAPLDLATSTLPLLLEFRAEYDGLRARRDRTAARYAELCADGNEYYDFDGAVRLKFRPNGLATAESMPANLSWFADPKLKPSPPSQKALSSVSHHEAWCALFDA